MKKIFCIVLLFVYLIPTIGFSVSLHYCCGKIKSIGVENILPTKACCKGKTMKKGCCQNKTISLKKSFSADVISKTILAYNPVHLAPTNNLQYCNTLCTLLFKLAKIGFTTHSPPPDAKHPIYIKINSFLI